MNIPEDYLKGIFFSKQIESFVNDRAPAILAGENSSGGTAFFRDQSACTFRAFARHRLHVETINKVDIGLDAAERGSLLHKIM